MTTKLLTAASIITLAANSLTAAHAEPNQNAFDHANPNAKFLRCGTKHPSAEEAKSIEKRFREKLFKAQGQKKPSDKPRGGNGGNGDTTPDPGPGVPVSGSILIDTYVHIICTS